MLLMAVQPAWGQFGMAWDEGYSLNGEYDSYGGDYEYYDDYYDDYDYYGDDGHYGGDSYSDDVDDYVCYQCPACQQIFMLTAQEAEDADPYTLCPNCGRAYAYSFVQVSCPAGAGLDDGPQMQTEDDDENDSQEDSGLSVTGPTGDKSTAVTGMSSLGSGSNTSDDDSSSAGRILMVIPPRDFRDDELDVPRDIFARSGYQVVVVSNDTVTASGMLGGEVAVDLDLKDVVISDYLAVIYVGGVGVDDLMLYENPDYLSLADGARRADLTIGAICLAPKILASAGVLTGKNATLSVGEDAYITARGANYLDQSVVRDGKIVTGDGPEASEEFATTILEVLAEASDAGPSDAGVEDSETGHFKEVDGALAIPL